MIKPGKYYLNVSRSMFYVEHMVEDDCLLVHSACHGIFKITPMVGGELDDCFEIVDEDIIEKFNMSKRIMETYHTDQYMFCQEFINIMNEKYMDKYCFDIFFGDLIIYSSDVDGASYELELDIYRFNDNDSRYIKTIVEEIENYIS